MSQVVVPSLVTGLQSEVSEVVKYRYVVLAFTSTNTRLRYRRSFLGFFWTLLAPLLNFGIIAFVFSYMSRFSVPNYLLFFSVAVLPYSFMTAALTATTMALISNESYIKKIYLPKSIFILNAIGPELVNFLFSFFAVSGLLILLGQFHVHWSLLFLPISLILTCAFVLGVGLILAVVTVFFRDVAYIVRVVFQALVFATPIYYELGSLPAPVQSINIWLNPFYYFVELFRVPIYNGRLPNLSILIVCGLLSMVSLLLGGYTIRRFGNSVVFKL